MRNIFQGRDDVSGYRNMNKIIRSPPLERGELMYVRAAGKPRARAAVVAPSSQCVEIEISTVYDIYESSY
jgi:hypothetical protein